jgi:hypothetical protein
MGCPVNGDFNELLYIPCAVVISYITLSKTEEANCPYFSSFKIIGNRVMTEEFPTGST